MATKIPGWVKVGGIGCGVLILIGLALVAGSAFFVRDALHEFSVADSSMQDVEDRHGSISSFHPRSDGVIPSDRIGVFLAVRDANATGRAEMDRSLATLSGSENEVAFASLRKFKAGVGMLRDTARFLAGRNESLIDAGMGLGEYYYLYTLAYYSWLGKSPTDGPSFRLVGDSGYVMEEVRADLEESEVREHRGIVAAKSLNELLLPVLRRQLSELEDGGDAADRQVWREALAMEIAAMESDERRLPWAEGLPEVIEASLQPHRTRLEESYSAMCNALEIGVARR